MKKLTLILILFLAYRNISHGQINILELVNKKDISERVTYDYHKNEAMISIVDVSKESEDVTNYMHHLIIMIRDITKCPLNTKIAVKSKKGDNLTCGYYYSSWKNKNDNYNCDISNGYIEFVGLTDSSFQMDLNFTLIKDNGDTTQYFYKGLRSFSITRPPTQEAISAKLISLGLDSLIKRFDTYWQLKETGKAYWIGYTDEMYAIATKKDSAINILVNYINSSHNPHGRIGAVYCLHLIGINSEIVGRFVEKFTNANARNALLSLIDQEDLTDLIISLLARDPWQSDLPVLSQMLKSGSNKTLINALFRYWIDSRDEIPFRDSISTSTKSIKVFFNDSLGIHELGDIITVYQEKEDEQPVFTTKNTKSLKSGDRVDLNYSDGYTNKANLLNQDGNVFMQFGYAGIRTVRKFIPRKGAEKIIEKFVDCKASEIRNSKCDQLNQLFSQFFELSQVKVDVFSYCNFWESVFHYMRAPDEMIICDLETARQRWLQLFKIKGL